MADQFDTTLVWQSTCVPRKPILVLTTNLRSAAELIAFSRGCMYLSRHFFSHKTLTQGELYTVGL